MGWLQLFNPANRGTGEQSIPGIHSTTDFRAILDRERARTDRSGQPFALVVFGVGSANGGFEMAGRYLAGVLKNRIRNSDALGWFDSRALAAILPDTPSDGAWQFADTVRSGVASRIPLLHCSVYSYPSQWIDQSRQEDRGERRKDTASPVPASGGARLSVVPGGSSPRIPSRAIESLLGQPIPAWKRLFDVVGASAGLLLLSPLFLLVAAFIKVVSPGPVFFRQTRVGYQGRPFTIWKFRTMHVNNDPTRHQQYLSTLIKGGDQPMTKLDADRDPRIIPFGKVMRQSCVDELPQLINVLLGDMSMVGPRPCLPGEAAEFSLWHTARFDTLPGMTGLWQVNGKNRTTFKQMMRFDIRYSRQCTPWMDLKILFKTFPAIASMVLEKFLASPLAAPVAAKETASSFRAVSKQA